MGGKGSGGARMGSGRKSRSLEKKVLDGRSAKFIPMSDFSDVKCDVPKSDDFMKRKQADGRTLAAQKIYDNTYKWLHSVGCDKLVSQELVQKYSWLYARFMDCEDHISDEGYVVKCEANGGKMINAHQKMSESYSKQADSAWALIYQIVKENATVEFNNMSEDPMEKMLRGQAK